MHCKSVLTLAVHPLKLLLILLTTSVLKNYCKCSAFTLTRLCPHRAAGRLCQEVSQAKQEMEERLEERQYHSQQIVQALDKVGGVELNEISD